MALHQHTLTVVTDLPAGPVDRYGQATWTTGLQEPKLIGAVAVLPRGGNVTGSRGVDVRARVDEDSVTVEVSGDVSGPIDVLITVEG
jgi:alkylated DNA nucleotide flippase Atl1